MNKLTNIITCIWLLAFIPLSALAQTQLGTDIDGEASYDFMRAVSLSANGSRLALGAGQNDGVNGADSGHVRIYEWAGSTWTQLGADIDGKAAGDWFGDAVSISADGNRVAAGAHTALVGGQYTGQVRVYQWTGSAWEQMGGDIDGEAAGDSWGLSVSISADGSRVAATSSENGDAGAGYGHVRVFEWSGSAWVQVGGDIDGKDFNNRIQSVSLSATGDRVALGAWGHGGNRGQARVYEWSNEAWVQMGADIDGEAGSDRFGTSVALAPGGSRLAVGAPANDGNGSNSGHVRVFEWSGSEWLQVGNDIDGEGSDSLSGNSVSLSYHGNRLVIGASSNINEGSVWAGHVRIYEWSEGAWTQIGSDIDAERINDAFGYQVSISSNGNRVAASADQNDGDGYVNCGHARVFDLGAFNVFLINPGLNDHWYNPLTDGQGYYITVFPDLGKVNLTGFTWDTEHPPQGATAHFGNPGHRWFNALGNYADDQAVMNIKVASGGLFDTPVEQAPVTRVKDGTIILTFDGCNSGMIEYDIPSISRTGTVPIERIVGDNIALCEAFLEQVTGN